MARAQNSSGGPSFDGWDAAEVKFFPLQVFDLTATFVLDCLEYGHVPKQFLQSRMICIPKTDNLDNYQSGLPSHHYVVFHHLSICWN